MWGTLEVVGAQGVMGTPTSWLVGDAPDGRLLGTLTFGQLFGVRLRVLGWWNSEGGQGAEKIEALGSLGERRRPKQKYL